MSSFSLVSHMSNMILSLSSERPAVEKRTTGDIGLRDRLGVSVEKRIRYLAEEVERDAPILKQVRKAREERNLRKPQ